MATLLWALRELGFEASERPRLLILGARSGMEGWLAARRAFDGLLEAYPVAWRIDLVGPEMEEKSWSGRIEVRGFRQKGDEYLRENECDLVVPGRCFSRRIRWRDDEKDVKK